MDLGLSGKRALVAGASSGLGYAAAEALAAEGAQLVIASRTRERIEAAGERIAKATGVSAVCVAADVATDDGLQAVEAAVKDAGGVDILVSNAGGPPPGQLLALDARKWHDAGRLVLESAVRMTYAVIAGMVERHWGRLIYITSIGVLQPVDDLILSNTYRAGVTGFCKTVSNNYAKHGITANCVCPGYTLTERLQRLAASRGEASGRSAEEALQDFAGLVPAGRLGKPEELGALIAFLAGERAGYISGSSIAVDGGANRALI